MPDHSGDQSVRPHGTGRGLWAAEPGDGKEISVNIAIRTNSKPGNEHGAFKPERHAETISTRPLRQYLATFSRLKPCRSIGRGRHAAYTDLYALRSGTGSTTWDWRPINTLPSIRQVMSFLRSGHVGLNTDCLSSNDPDPPTSTARLQSSRALRFPLSP